MPNKHQYGQLLKRANALADAWKLWLEGDAIMSANDEVMGSKWKEGTYKCEAAVEQAKKLMS